MIKIKNLSKKYNDQYALKAVDLELPSKWLIGISKESGSGKTIIYTNFLGRKLCLKRKSIINI